MADMLSGTLWARGSDGIPKSIPRPRLCQDVLRPGGIIFDFLAKYVDVGPQIFQVVSVFRAPNATQELHVGNDSVLVLEQIGKKVELLGSEMDFPVPLPGQTPIRDPFSDPGAQDPNGTRPPSALDLWQAG